MPTIKFYVDLKSDHFPYVLVRFLLYIGLYKPSCIGRAISEIDSTRLINFDRGRFVLQAILARYTSMNFATLNFEVCITKVILLPLENS